MPKLVCAITSKSAGNSNFPKSKHWKIKNLLAQPVFGNRNCFVFSEKTFIKVLSRSFHKFFWWQGFAFTCFLSSTVGLLIVLLLLLPLVVLAPYEKVFFMLFSKKRGGVLSCNFFSTLFYWWLETLHQKTCHPVIISPLNKS